MANVNITEVRLLNVPLTNDYIHTLCFNTPAEQSSYFLSKTVTEDGNQKRYTNFSYQRKDNIIRIPDHYDSLLNCNYVMYKNSSYSSKWFYAFITDLTYIDDGRTDVKIETDVIQTWLFDYEVQASFIEREHVDNDEIGRHTVPECVEHGEYICNMHTKAGYCEPDTLDIVVGSTKNTVGDDIVGKLYNNIYSGINYYVFDNDSDGVAELKTFLNGYAENGEVEAVVCMFLAPRRMITRGANFEVAQSTMIDTQFINGDPNLSFNTVLDMTTGKIQGYEPKNKKLLCYPYRYLLVSNNAGCSVPFPYEQFKNSDGTIRKPYFKIEGCLCPGTSVRMIPMNYKGIGRNDEEGINLGKFPCLNWTSDVYTNWLTQNGLNINASIAGGVIGAGIGVASAFLAPATGGMSLLAGAAALTGGISSVASTIGEVQAHSMQPPQASGNLNSGDVVTASGNNDFHFYDMTIKAEYARIIDEFFTMYGYKVNRVKKPSKWHRENFWYLKTIDVNISGAIPMNDLQKIKACYNKGITFWSNPANIGNYNVTNLPCG